MAETAAILDSVLPKKTKTHYGEIIEWHSRMPQRAMGYMSGRPFSVCAKHSRQPYQCFLIQLSGYTVLVMEVT